MAALKPGREGGTQHSRSRRILNTQPQRCGVAGRVRRHMHMHMGGHRNKDPLQRDGGEAGQGRAAAVPACLCRAAAGHDMFSHLVLGRAGRVGVQNHCTHTTNTNRGNGSRQMVCAAGQISSRSSRRALCVEIGQAGSRQGTCMHTGRQADCLGRQAERSAGRQAEQGRHSKSKQARRPSMRAGTHTAPPRGQSWTAGS